MNDHSRARSTDAYTSPPRSRKPGRASVLVPAGAGVAAAAAGLVWFFSPGFSAPKAPAPLPAAPSAEPVLAMPERPAAPRARAAAAPAAPLRAEAEAAPASASFKRDAVEQPAWVKAKVSQAWTWPRRVGILDEEGTVSRKLIGWFPSNAAGKTLQFLLTADRVETRLYEDEIPAFEARRAAEAEARRAAAEALARAQQQAAALAQGQRQVGVNLEQIRQRERESLRAQKGAAAVRDVTVNGGPAMAEFVYAGGKKEVVPYDPLVFDLKDKGIKTTTKKVLFDLYGYGKAEKIQWMNDLDEGTGILVFDSNGSGRSGKTGSEVFGDRTDLTGVGQPGGFANGFEALHGLARKAVAEGVLHQEVLDRAILDSDALAALEKAYGLRMKVGGFNHEAVSLAEAGVKAIALSQAPAQRVADFDDQANDLLVQPGAVFLRRDGTTGTYMNVWLKAKLGNLGLKKTVLK
ncbi:MAG: hypothetical protein PHS14_01045 [Elusimicrobia bacterium]|nr:hypothetical protein [Elusimicrobiota bacterium]